MRGAVAGRIRPLRYEQVYAFGALLEAFRRARRRKRGRGGEPAFYAHLEHNLLELSGSLRERRFVPDPYVTFTVRHGKDRLVSEASFRDRVVHHALVGALEPHFAPQFIRHTYACLRGRGTHAALERVRGLARRHRYFAKLDIQRYFESMRHRTLAQLLGRRVEDSGLRWLCGVLIRHGGGADTPGRGLPIGNLTSQFWANVYLDPLDQFVVRQLGQLATWTRYMDDMLIFGEDKRALWEVVGEVRRFAAEHLGLEVKDRLTRVAPCHDGVPWLGHRVFPALVRLDRAGRRRFARKLRNSTRRARSGPAAERAEAPRAASLCGHVTQPGTAALRRAVLAWALDFADRS